MERRRIIALFCVLIIIVLALVLLLTHCGRSDSTTETGDTTAEAEATVTPEASVTVITPAAETGSAYTPEPTTT
ncbi:MAG: hypothetical protein LUC89_02075, partial [Oscillospiraceae bacterium]|nr:hypothetical protein [Oscillospiraceae bacterium]